MAVTAIDSKNFATGSTTVTNGPATYYGFTVRETTGTTGAIVKIYGNTAASGPLLDTIALVAGESAGDFYPGGQGAAGGITVQVVTGTVEGSIKVG